MTFEEAVNEALQGKRLRRPHYDRWQYLSIEKDSYGVTWLTANFTLGNFEGSNLSPMITIAAIFAKNWETW